MAVPSVTFDGVRVNASDSSTNWGNFGSGGGAPASEAQIAYQGTAVNTQVKTTALDGIDYDPGSGAINMTTAGNKLWFAKCIVSDGADVNATKGAVLFCGSANNAYDGWVVAGTGEVSNTGVFAEYPAQLGYIITAINPAITAWHDSALGSGSPSYTAVDWFGFQAAMVVGGAKSENVALDAIDVGRGLNLVGGDGASDDAVFADFVAADQDTGTNRWGVVVSKFGIIYAQGLLVVGRNASGTVVHTDFTDPDGVLVFPDAYIDEGDFGVEFDITNASSVMSFGGTIIGRGALVSGNDTRPDLIVTGTGGTLDLSCKLQNFRNITLNSATTVAGGAFEFLDMTQGTAEITNSTLRTTSAANAASIDDATFGTSSGIHDTEFIQGGLGHAVQITAATQTITLTNMTWTGYGADNTSSSAIEFTGTGPHTVNVIGGTTPTIQDNGETVNVVSNPVTAKITTTTTANIPIEGARVLLLAANGTGDLPYKVDAADYSITSTVVTVNVSSHPFDTGQKVLIEADPQDEINGVHTITGTTATTFTFTVAGAPNTASEDCSYTGVVLEGVTDVNGEISDTRSYSLNQPVTGRARKGTVAPYFKNAPINGTINASTGFDVSVPMIPDGGILVAVAPSAPGSVTATAQDGSADLAWATPFNGGSPITDYLIDYQTVPAGGWTLFADGTNTSAFTTVTGLTNGTEYEFRVAAVNDEGTSEESPTSNAVTVGTPNEPTALGATPGDTEVALSWTAPNDTNGSAITDYRVEYKPPAGSWTLFVDGVSTATTATVTGLTNDTSYQFRVAGINANGTGPFSATATATPVAAGGPASFVSDDFNRADEADIAGWTEIVDATETVEIVSNAIQFDGTNVVAINDQELDGDVQWAEALVAGQSGSTGWREWGVGVRMLTDASDRSGYMVFAGPATSTSAEITKIELNRIATNGSRTTLDSVLDVPDLIGKRIGISIDASGNMKAYIDGLEVTNLAATDTTHAAGATRRKAGVWGYNASDTHTVDDFEAGTGAFSSGGHSDSFTYADATNLNAQSAWTAATGSSITTQSNEVLISSESAVQATFSTALTGDLTNVYAQVDVTTIAGTGAAKSVNVEVRRLTDNTSTTDRMAYFRYEHGAGDWVLKYRDSGNAEQTVTTTGGTAPTAPYTARLEARGELYIGYADGVEVVRGTISEAALPHTHTYTGFHTFQATNTTIDNFECGTLEPDVLFTSIDFVNDFYGSPQQTVSGNSAFTPTNGSLLVVVAKATCDDHTTAHSWAISDTQGLTWTQRSITGTIFDGPNFGMQAVCWTAPVVTGASTLITVDAFDGSTVNGIYGFRIIEVNAHDAASPIVQSANNIDLTADPLTVTLGSTPAAGNVLTAWLGDMDGSGSWDAPMTGFASFGTVDNSGDSPSCLRESTTSTATAITQGQSFTASYYGSAGFAIEFNPLS